MSSVTMVSEPYAHGFNSDNHRGLRAPVPSDFQSEPRVAMTLIQPIDFRRLREKMPTLSGQETI